MAKRRPKTKRPKKGSDGKPADAYRHTGEKLDVFDPVTMQTTHQKGDDVPAWFLDSDYDDLVFRVTRGLRVVVYDTGPVLHLREAEILPVLGSVGDVVVPSAVDRELSTLVSGWASERTLILETKGYDPLADVKAAGARRWVAAVNADGSYGRWAYRMITNPADGPLAIHGAVKELAGHP